MTSPLKRKLPEPDCGDLTPSADSDISAKRTRVNPAGQTSSGVLRSSDSLPQWLNDKNQAHESAAFMEHSKLLWLTRERLKKWISENEWSDVNWSLRRCDLAIQQCSALQICKNARIWRGEMQKMEEADGSRVPKPLPLRESDPTKDFLFEDIKVGDSFGPSWANHVFRTSFSIDQQWLDLVLNNPKEFDIRLRWNSNCEAALFEPIAQNDDSKTKEEFKMIWSFSDGGDVKCSEFPLTVNHLKQAQSDAIKSGSESSTSSSSSSSSSLSFRFTIEVACNRLFGCHKGHFLDPPSVDYNFNIDDCEMVLCYRPCRDLFYDMSLMQEISELYFTKHRNQDSVLKSAFMDESHFAFGNLAMLALKTSNSVMNLLSDIPPSPVQRALKSIYSKSFSLRSKLQNLSKSSIPNRVDVEYLSLLQTAVNRARGLVFKEFYNCMVLPCQDESPASSFSVYLIGNTHIDTAWLWSYPVTRGKIARSFARQLSLIDWYHPRYQFMATAAQHFAWLKEDCPELYDRVKKAVSEEGGGLFQVTGGTWVEMDGNIPSGESFLRQFIYGQRYFQQEFGYDCRAFVLPDTFGYSGNLPQLMKHCGLDYFLTQKLSWNLINPFPHSSFVWKGIDGTGVLTHFAPANTYVSTLSVSDLVSSADQLKNKAVSQESLLLFGYGDGGGGPTEMHMERLVRLRGEPPCVIAPGSKPCQSSSIASDAAAKAKEDSSLSLSLSSAKRRYLRGMPSVHSNQGPLAFFDRLNESRTRLPKWYGELYFEMHRGTYTTHAAIKKGNRRCERLLQQCEFLCSLSLLSSKCEYPSQKMEDCWKRVLLNQFHDVLPGSSIELANIEARQIHQSVIEELTSLIESVLGKPDESAVTVTNTRCTDRRQIITVPQSFLDQCKGATIQKITNPALCPADSPESSESAVTSAFVMCECPGCSVSLLNPLSVPESEYCKAEVIEVEHSPMSMSDSSLCSESSTKRIVLQNEHLSATIDEFGRLTSLIHRRSGRECLKQFDNRGYGNSFVVYDDRPLFWDAWDVEIYHGQTGRALVDCVSPARIVCEGPLRCEVECELCPRLCGNDVRIKQRIILEAGSKMIEFDTTVDWRSVLAHKMLKVEFPLSFVNARQLCNYGIQFGYLARPTVANTSTDLAKFEVCAQEWADLAEADHSGALGVSLLNDCKYGYSCLDNILALSLLRSPQRPDANADRHCHRFKYALFPHIGNFQDCGTVESALNLNSPLLLGGIGSVLSSSMLGRSLFALKGGCPGQVVLDTTKKAFAEDSRDLVLRLYECFGSSCPRLTVCSALTLKAVFVCNALESEQQSIPFNADCFELCFNAFQIQTVRVSFA